MDNAPQATRPGTWQRVLGLTLIFVCLHLTSCAAAVRTLFS